MERRLAAILAADVVGYSRLVRADEEGTITALQELRADLIDPKLGEHHGRIVKLMGDGILVEFASVVDAVKAANQLQISLALHNAALPQNRKIEFRIGINLGDVIIDGDDIQGDGVNVAARLEDLSEPGGLCISGAVFEQIRDRIDLAFENLGPQQLKNIDRPVQVYRRLSDARSSAIDQDSAPAKPFEQEINFCTSSDGVQIAYATVGEGPPLVKTANWLNHLEYDWQSPAWRHMLTEFSSNHQLVRYDERGNGLSDWNVDDLSFETWVRDLECVVDEIGLEKFALFGVSQGCAVSIAYAVRHPERVTRLVLYGGYARGQLMRGTSTDVEASNALITLMRQGWGGDNPAFRQINTALFMPDATPEQKQWFSDLQRVTTSPENAVRFWQEFNKIDVSDLLSKVTVPTLVLHCRDEAAVPFAEGQRMARMIPGARFVALEGQNHLILDSDPGWPRFLDEVLSFLGEDCDDLDTTSSPTDTTDAEGAEDSGDADFPTLPDKPSIAVLPFDNMSGDPEQEYFADGLTEDIITELSRFQSFFVIARHSTFIYKSKPVTVQDVGRELSVHYVVEGSVRRAGNRLRVVVQLIEANSGNNIWAERYDHDLTDIFDLQDEVTRSIVGAIPGRLESADLNRIKRKRPEDLAVYDYVLRSKMHHHRITRDDNAEALRLLDKAIEMDPEFAEAYAWKACTLGQALARGFGDNKEELFAQDVEAVEKALSLDENNFECHWIMCEVRMMVARLEEAELHHQKAFDLNSNDPRVVAQRSELLTWLGRPLEGADWARQSMRLDPHNAAGRAHLLGRALFVAGSYADAIEAFKQVRAPSFQHHAEIAACHAQLGSDQKARQHAGEVLRLKPDFSIADHVQGLPFKEPRDRDQYRDGLNMAGLPE